MRTDQSASAFLFARQALAGQKKIKKRPWAFDAKAAF
jgi:hypothetical protein